MNVLELISAGWDWVRGRAFQQLLALLLLAALAFLALTRYPVSIDISSTEVKDYVEVTMHTQYIVRTEASTTGARIKFCTNTYYGEVKKLAANEKE